MEIYCCRICGGELFTVLNLGEIYPSAFIIDEVPQMYPLILTECKVCKLVQLKHTNDPDAMYRNYWYRSSLNPSMLRALRNVVDSTLLRYGREEGVVLDIGANDGSMLSMFPEGFYTIGYDPARNLVEEAGSRCDIFVNDYFNLKRWPNGLRADIVTAIAMFYDLNNPRAFLGDVHAVLSDDGIFVLQMTDLVSMLEANAFDNICHEHLCYYSLLDLVRLLGSSGFIVFDVEYNSVNGGSIRVYATKERGRREQTERLGDALAREAILLTGTSIMSFSTRVMSIGLAIMGFVARLASEKKTLYGLGASTKGNTLLQYFNLDHKFIRAIGEVNPDKFGRKTVGTSIPIIPEEEVLAQDPGCIIILPWHFEHFFIDRLWDYMEHGQVLFPLPQPRTLQVVNGKLMAIYLLTGEHKWLT